MTPGWTSRSEDAAATVDAARRWGRRRRTTADLADIGRACAGLTSTLTALGGVAEDARKGLYRYSGGALLTHDELPPDDWQGHQDRGEAGVEAARSRLDLALKLPTGLRPSPTRHDVCNCRFKGKLTRGPAISVADRHNSLRRGIMT